MYRVLSPANAAFSASAGTITFTTEVPISLSHVLKVANQTRGEILFDPSGASGPGYMQNASYAAGVLTLGVPTHDHANSDELFIEYDDGEAGGGGGGGGGGGHATAANQTLQLTELQAINADLGAPTDAPAASPTATAGIGGLIRLGLEGLATALTNWTTLLARIPALQSGNVPVVTTASVTDPTGNGTRGYDFANALRQAFTATSTAAVALPTLGTSREVMLMPSTRCFVRFGDSGVAAAAAAAGNLALAADERFHLRIPVGVTHLRVIRDTADGNLGVTAVL
jgi:hypothetical protein